MKKPTLFSINFCLKSSLFFSNTLILSQFLVNSVNFRLFPCPYFSVLIQIPWILLSVQILSPVPLENPVSTKLCLTPSGLQSELLFILPSEISDFPWCHWWLFRAYFVSLEPMPWNIFGCFVHFSAAFKSLHIGGNHKKSLDAFLFHFVGKGNLGTILELSA